MEYRILTGTEIEVSTIAFGCWPIVGGFNWGHQERADSLASLRTAYDEGITFYDTAEGYGKGESERMIAEALGDERDNIVIASKVSPNHLAPDDLRAALEGSLERLNTDYIDLYQIHWPNWDIPLEDTLATLAELQEEGKILAVGVSNFGPRDLEACLASEVTIASNQIAYNLLFRAPEYEIQPICAEADVSILPYCPLMQGLLTGKFRTADDVPEDRARTRHFAPSRPNADHDEAGCEALVFEAVAALESIARNAGVTLTQAALAWLLAQDAVPSVLVGARNVEQVRANAACGDVRLDSDTILQMNEATEAVKKALGLNADMWLTASRMR